MNKDQFFAYLQEPTPGNFLALRESVLTVDSFNPYDSDLDNLGTIIEAGRFEDAMKRIAESLYPNYFLSPGMHMQLGFVFHKLGDEKSAKMEQSVSLLLLNGIEQTGDGTEEHPFLVTRTSDEYDYLFAKQLTAQGQRLVKSNDREYDVIAVEYHEDIWFDITDIKRILADRIKMR